MGQLFCVFVANVYRRKYAKSAAYIISYNNEFDMKQVSTERNIFSISKYCVFATPYTCDVRFYDSFSLMSVIQIRSWWDSHFQKHTFVLEWVSGCYQKQHQGWLSNSYHTLVWNWILKVLPKMLTGIKRTFLKTVVIHFPKQLFTCRPFTSNQRALLNACCKFQGMKKNQPFMRKEKTYRTWYREWNWLLWSRVCLACKPRLFL